MIIKTRHIPMKLYLYIHTVSLAGADRVEASDPVELDNASNSLIDGGNVSLIHLRYSMTSSVTRTIRPSKLHHKFKYFHNYYRQIEQNSKV